MTTPISRAQRIVSAFKAMGQDGPSLWDLIGIGAKALEESSRALERFPYPKGATKTDDDTRESCMKTATALKKIEQEETGRSDDVEQTALRQTEEKMSETVLNPDR